VPRPRILLVPHLSELDWRIKPLLEEWAQVASFDAPGVGDEPPPDAFTTEAVVERGVAELDRRGWDHCVVVGDELGARIAVHLAAAVPARLDALALGHACVKFRRQGERPTVSPEVWAAMVQMARTDYRSYARMLTHFSQGAYDDELVDRYIKRVPGSVATAYLEALLERQEGEDLEPATSCRPRRPA
jgi:pimeloyl-ACP methyl ester carboxylesterase